ncbi:hypothetical protein Vadar_002064 [Vaccinium darrowii]|uniref:Uncharacterized protein n=1 Tax=Vaccinium darrowii TaxID=229202 RepID=A0ACB7YCB1_9ERIC|nr:hypothetical protein Vadar_002064 [Vaccinium darrowii]
MGKYILSIHTIGFENKKDSVLLVTNEEYDKCKSSHPLFFSNNGDTVFKVDKPGLFYFISGVAGHCDRGLKMIVKVLEPESPPPPPSSNETSGGGVKAARTISSSTVVIIATQTLTKKLSRSAKQPAVVQTTVK